jgi:electron transport complex protein RnfB
VQVRAATELIARIDACLPQTQCTRCGYPHCRAYAEAIAAGSAAINRCPPGDGVTIAALARLLAVPPRSLDPGCGEHQQRTRAMIDEGTCIGCRKCIDACPVDAIIGARRLMHTVIAADCTGCALCVPPCPVDCISMIPVSPYGPSEGLWPDYKHEEVDRWRALAQSRLARLASRTPVRRNSKRPVRASAPDTKDERSRIRAEIRAAVERTRARKRNP